MKKLFAWAVAAGFVLTPGAALAQSQPWLADRRLGEGAGIRTGDLELHPSVAGEVGYDSNYFQNSGDPGEPEISAWRLRITPALSLRTLGSQRADERPRNLKLNAYLSASYNELIANDSARSEDVSSQRHVNANAGFKVDIAPSRPWGGDLYVDFTRLIQPSNSPDTNAAFDRDAIRAGAGVIWRPGGGLFDWRLGYEYQHTFFEQATFEDLDNGQHYIKTQGRWRFLPRTALMYDASLGFIRYSRTTGQQDSSPVRARIGVNGLVTNRFALLALVGWGASFYESRDGKPVQDFDSLIAQGELKWFINPQPSLEASSADVGLSSVAVGYLRDFRNSYLGDYYQLDRGHLRFDYYLGGMVVVALEGGLSHITYPQSFFDNGTPRFGAYEENRADVTLFGEYRTSDSFGINATLRYNANLTETRIPISATPGGPTDNLKFARYEAWLGARWFM
ncbi:MAG: outer membrane beta-barrel protein [Polyangiaceae bacterium]